MMNKRRFSADFETCTWIENETYVWCWATCEIGAEYVTEWGTDIDSFFKWCEIQGNIDIYFHNLKFDGEFIINYLLSNNFRCVNTKEQRKEKKKHEANTFTTVISDMGQFFKIQVHLKNKITINFYDSLKIIPLSVEKMPSAFGINLKKLDLDYNKPREKGYVPNKEEIEYIINDVKIPAMALDKMFSEGLNKITQASNAMSDYKEIIGKNTFRHFFPQLEMEIDKDIRKSYRGGFTYCNPIYESKEVENGIGIDVNSLYPSVMLTCELPISQPIFFEGKYQHDDLYNLYVQKIRCMFEIKPNKIPTIQLKNNKSFVSTEYLRSSEGQVVVLTLTNIDLKLFFEQYNVECLDYLGGWKFRGCKGLFSNYINKWYEIKARSKEEKNDSMYTISKLMQNSLYGKFGLNPKTKEKIPYLKDGIVKYIESDEKEREPIYIPIASFITSYAREKTIRTAQAITDYSIKKYGVDKYCYSDTDSIYCLLSEDEIKEICEIDEIKIGAWDLETKFKRGKFIRQKCYILELKDKPIEKSIKITCAGMPKNCYGMVTFDNFEEGLEVDGKLTYKHVVGGVKLVETTFKIKHKKMQSFLSKK